MADQKLISLVIPVYNEAPNIPLLHQELIKHIDALPYQFEILFVDDGSSDNSAMAVDKLTETDNRVQLIQLARNFGKEAAVSAGLRSTQGAAAIIMDADLQMPPKLIGQFIRRWKEGAEIVIGVFAERNMSPLKRLGAHSFYWIMQTIAHSKITPNATDFRLLDRQVIQAFNSLTERNRITRGLIDWLGFKRSYVHFKQEARRYGQPTYTYRKLITLAVNSFTSYSLIPLKLAGYMGLFILTISIPAGLFMYVEKYLLDDPLNLLFSGTDMLAILILFLVGVVLACLGLIALYIAHIHAEVINRPLYVVRQSPTFITPAEVKGREPVKQTMRVEEALEG
ncbi:MAG: glycosyltransferase family 2 protein [Patescibacteria group bacterium]